LPTERVFRKPGAVALLVLLGLMASLPGFAVDMALPALANTAASLDVPAHSAGLTISSYMISFAIAPLIFGPLSDRYGRKPVVTFGCIIFILAGIDEVSNPRLRGPKEKRHKRLAVMDMDGANIKYLDGGKELVVTPRFSPSAQQVAYMSFGDGDRGFATDGTPVDCVRFAELGLVGHRPDLIVSGINHGANLGDDITYSGTVAAALEGIVLGIPAVALSQQSAGGGMGYVSGRFG